MSTDPQSRSIAELTKVKEQVRQNSKPVAIVGGILVLFVLWRLLRK